MDVTEDLTRALIEYEKKIFYEKTQFEELTGCGDLDFTAPGRYDVIYNHILVHKYFLNQHTSEEIPFSDALVSWYNKVYCPVIDIIKEQWLLLHFPGRRSRDPYVRIVKHRDFLKKNTAPVPRRKRPGIFPKNTAGAAESCTGFWLLFLTGFFAVPDIRLVRQPGCLSAGPRLAEVVQKLRFLKKR